MKYAKFTLSSAYPGDAFPRYRSALKNNRNARKKPLLETLEDRRLLAGLTLVTHGFQLFGDRPDWLDDWQGALKDRAGPEGETVSQYEIFIGEDSSSINKYVPDTPALDENTTGEVILTVDWAERSNDFVLFGDGSVSTTDIIAAEVLPYLTQAFPAIGITQPLAQLPIHLLGHSRGGSMVAELARLLGEAGAWVEQLTMLDPHPLTDADSNVDPDEADPILIIGDNVYYADDYWRENDDILDFNGQPVNGADNIHLDDAVLADGGYSSEHSDVHMFYYGTINTSPNAEEEGTVVPDHWYPDMGFERDRIGYYFSRLGGGFDRISPDLVGESFTGNAPRTTLIHNGMQWPDIMISAQDTRLRTGENLQIQYGYQDYDSPAQITAWLDDDQNPFNGHLSTTLFSSSVSSFPNVNYDSASWTVTDDLSGRYYIVSRIDDGSLVRYNYAPTPITFIANNSDQQGSFSGNDGFMSPGADITGNVVPVYEQQDNPLSFTPGMTSFSSRPLEPGAASASSFMKYNFLSLPVDLSFNTGRAAEKFLIPVEVHRFSRRDAETVMAADSAATEISVINIPEGENGIYQQQNTR